MRGLPRSALRKTAQVIRATTTDTGLSEKQDWGNPTVTATVRGSLQPANAELAVKYGLNGVTITHQAFLQPVTLTPGQDRLLIDGKQFIVRTVQAYTSHTEALVEEQRG